MSKLNRLNARRKINNGKAREVYPPLTQEQEKAFKEVEKKWEREVIPKMYLKYLEKLEKQKNPNPRNKRD